MLTKYTNCEILEVKQSKDRLTGRQKMAAFDHLPKDTYRTNDGYLYMTVRAISSRVNKNWDGWPSVELAGTTEDKFKELVREASEQKTAKAVRSNKIATRGDYGFKTFIGRPIFVDHNNSDPERTRGVIVDAILHIEDPNKKRSARDYYSTAPDNHKPETWIELLLEVDAKSFPKFAEACINGDIDAVSMGCFLPGTLITLADGTQKIIEEIREGDDVLTHTGKVEPVTHIMVRPHKGIIYDVKTYGQSDPMLVTGEHPIWVRRIPNTTRRKKWESDKGACICGKSFETRRSFGAHIREMKLQGKQNEHSTSSREFEGWVDAADLQVGDYVLTPNITETIPSDYNIARLLGYYLAEGNLGWDKKRTNDPVFVEWNFHIDEWEYIVEVQALIEHLGYKAAGPYTKNNCTTVRCNSPELAQKMLMLGGQHSHNKKLRSDVLRWNPEHLLALLQAYQNGDGHERRGRITATTASQKLADQLFLVALKAGVRMTPPVKQISPIMVAHGNQPRYVMQSIEVPAKQSQQLAFLDEKGLWRRVIDISIKEYEGNVYNFDVGGDDSYVAADIAVHNCNVEETECSVCGNRAANTEEYCTHIANNNKGNIFTKEAGEKVHAYEDCYGVNFFEISAVFDPADETALTTGPVIAKTKKTAAMNNDKWTKKAFSPWQIRPDREPMLDEPWEDFSQPMQAPTFQEDYDEGRSHVNPDGGMGDLQSIVDQLNQMAGYPAGDIIQRQQPRPPYPQIRAKVAKLQSILNQLNNEQKLAKFRG